MLLQQAYIFTKARLAQASFIANSSLEARILLKHLLNITETCFISNINILRLDQKAQEDLESVISRRLAGEPIAYIIGIKDFWKSTFIVNSAVLIPRADSETLIEAVLQEIDSLKAMNILDIGVGSGCILFSLLLEYKNSFGVGIDISYQALQVAYDNACALKLKNYFLINTNLFQGLSSRFHLIVSNPPYIATNDSNISLNTKKYEPHLALYSTNEGLFFYHQILAHARDYLYSEGKIFLEIGFTQKIAIEKLLKLYHYNNYKFIQDLAGINRVVAISI